MRIGIIGTGAMASIFGGGLLGAGHNVVFLGKNAATVAALNERGLTVTRDGSPSSHHAASAVLAGASDAPDAAFIGICDVVLVLVKAYDTASALDALSPLVGPETVIVSLQNGMGACEMIASAFPLAASSGRIVQGVTYQGGTITGPGKVYHHSTKTTLFGTFRSTPVTGAGNGAGSNSAAEKVAALWRQAGWSASVPDDIEAEVWKKIVVNGVNAIAATTLLPSRAMTESPAVRQLVEDVVLEGMAVAHALGHTQLDERQAVSDILAVLAETPQGRTSMLQDIDAGRRTEIDVLNGAVIAAAERVGVEVPLNRALHARVVAWEIEHGLRTTAIPTR